MKIYSVFDKVAQKTLCVFAAPNDGLAIRENARSIARIMPLGDASLVYTGFDIEDSTGNVEKKTNFSVVDWNSYKFPENPIVQNNSSPSVPNVQNVK